MSAPPPFFPVAVPSLLEVAERLATCGHRSWWVGESLARALAGRPCRHMLVRTSASLAALVDALPEAVVVGRPDEPGLALRLTIRRTGGAALCIDALPASGAGGPEEIEATVAAAPFTRQALGIELAPEGPIAESWIDPHAGRSDIAARVLRSSGDAALLFAARPDFALRAVRYLGEDGLEPATELLEALAACKPELRGKNVARTREQLRCLFRHPHPAGALTWLRDTGLAAALAPGCRDDAPAVVERVEIHLERRLIAWLRGISSSRALRRLRFGAPLGARVLVLLDHHPIDATGRGGAIPTAQRHYRRLAPDDLDFLLRLREVEIEVLAQANPAAAQNAQASLAHMREALELAARDAAITHARQTLALHGEEVMEQLGCGPGRRVGDALQHLATLVVDAACANTREALDGALKRWALQHPDPGEAPGDRIAAAKSEAKREPGKPR